MVREAAAGDVTRGEAQDHSHSKGSGALCQAQVQEGLAADRGAARQGARLERARVRPPVREFGDVQGASGRGVPELGVRACEEQG